LGVICFTGYTRESLEQDGDAAELIAAVDLLIDGPYIADLPEDRRALVGSTNQRFINLTSRYADYDPADTPNRVEIRIGEDGTVAMAGFLIEDDLVAFSTSLDARRTFRSPRSATPQPSERDG